MALASLLLPLLLYSSWLLPAAAARTELTVEVGGQRRGLVVHTPAILAPAGQRTVLLVLHGSTQDKSLQVGGGGLFYPIERFEQNYDTALFSPQRECRGFVQVYLAARRGGGWYCWENGNAEVHLCSHKWDGNDEAAARAALTAAREIAGGEPFSRTYVMGHSGGSSMAWRLGCDSMAEDGSAALFDGVGAIAGAMAPSLQSCCCRARSIAAFQGDADTYVDVAFADQTADWFAEAHKCNAAMDSSPFQGVQLRDYQDCTEGRRLAYFRIAGAGHTLPGAPFVWAGLGATSEFNSMEAMWSVWTGEGACHSAGIWPSGLSGALMLVMLLGLCEFSR